MSGGSREKIKLKKNNKMLNQEEKNKIAQAINQKIQHIKCPMCKNGTFSIAEGYFNNFMQQGHWSNISIGGPSIPSIAIICTNCGFISQHALGALGLLPVEQKNNNENGEES